MSIIVWYHDSAGCPAFEECDSIADAIDAAGDLGQMGPYGLVLSIEITGPVSRLIQGSELSALLEAAEDRPLPPPPPYRPWVTGICPPGSSVPVDTGWHETKADATIGADALRAHYQLPAERIQVRRLGRG